MSPVHQSIAENHRHLYEVVRRKLRRGFRKCIRNLVQGQGGPALLARSRELWKREQWAKDAPGIALASRAGPDGHDWASSIGLIVAVRLGDTVRVILPVNDPEYFRRAISLLASDSQPPVLSLAQAYRVIHALINLTGEMRLPEAGSAEPLRGMLIASLASGLALYCGDVTQLGTDKLWTVRSPEGQVSFVSAAVDAERHLGMVSIAYIPIALETEAAGPAELVIGLFSSFRDAFGPSDGPAILDLEIIRPLLEEFRHDLQHSISSLRVFEQILGDKQPYVPGDLVFQLITELRNDPERVARHPPIWFAWLQAILNIAQQKPIVLPGADMVDRLCWGLEAGGFLTGLARDTAALHVFDASLYSRLLAHGFEAGRCDGQLRLAPEPAACLNLPNLENDVPAQAIAEVIRNTRKGLPGTTVVSIRSAPSPSPKWIIDVANKVARDCPHFLPEYWVVKQRHIHGNRPKDHTGGGTGMGLYGLRLLARQYGFYFEVNSPVPEPGADGPLCWCAQLKFHAIL